VTLFWIWRFYPCLHPQNCSESQICNLQTSLKWKAPKVALIRKIQKHIHHWSMLKLSLIALHATKKMNRWMV
jgi:hypothetical protein